MRLYSLLVFVGASTLACSSADFSIAGPGEDGSVSDTGEIVEDAATPDTTIANDTAEDPDAEELEAEPPPPQDTRPEITSLDTGCSSPTACPGGTDCQTPTCSGGVCGLANRAAGALCAGGKCNGFGKCVQCVVTSDCPASTECKTVSCASNVCTYAPSAAGIRCNSNTAYCDGAGRCVACLNGSHCPAAGSECKVPVCNSGVCGVGARAKGALCNGGVDQCDGLGACVDCTDNGGCGECCVCTMNKCVSA